MKWISVKTRLPDEEGLYLCLIHCDLDDSYDVMILSYSSLIGSDDFANTVPRWIEYDGEEVIVRKDVSHWVPMPSYDDIF